MIQRRTLGRTSLPVSEICLGTMNFGRTTDAQTSFDILDAFHQAGGNLIQATAPQPGATGNESTAYSEEIVGRWWQARGIARDQLVLGTRLTLENQDVETLAKTAVARCRESLARFGVSYLDVIVLEWSEALQPDRAALFVFDSLIREGLVRYALAANFPIWRVVSSLSQARQYNHCRMEGLQADYSLMIRARFEPEAMSLCREQRLAFLARAPLAEGFLASGSYAEADRFGPGYGEKGMAAVTAVARRHNVSPAQVSLAWVLHRPLVTSAVIGVHSPAQLRELLDACRIRFTPEDLALLEDATSAEEVRVPTRAPVSSERELLPFP
jgi:Predicted oxidoreductases (related to aryl-alcohol dehydrogenases)